MVKGLALLAAYAGLLFVAWPVVVFAVGAAPILAGFLVLPVLMAFAVSADEREHVSRAARAPVVYGDEPEQVVVRVVVEHRHHVEHHHRHHVEHEHHHRHDHQLALAPPEQVRQAIHGVVVEGEVIERRELT